tara:strand:+ start:85 stop:483 length:399 start_codon:yes stop_codon:yes gene_type:complete
MKELIAIQQELNVPKNQKNKFGNYNYRSCEDILVALKPLLAKHKASILITDDVKEVAGIPYVEATAVFKGQDTEALSVRAQAGINPNQKGMSISQSFGASSSYARKYALAGMFLLDDTKDADTMDNSKEFAL